MINPLMNLRFGDILDTSQTNWYRVFKYGEALNLYKETTIDMHIISSLHPSFWFCLFNAYHNIFDSLEKQPKAARGSNMDFPVSE